VRVPSGVAAGLLIKRVRPEYPEKARKKRIQGVVVLSAIISKEGDVPDVSVISGDPILAKAAMAAAKQWKYRPYLLQGEPVEVETQIQMNFTLSGS
jgi:protein TonB